MPIATATNENYETLVSQNGPLVAVFYKENDDRCYQRIRNAVEDFVQGEMPFVMVNIEHCRDVQTRWWVTAYPCFRLFRDGQFMANHYGCLGYQNGDTHKVMLDRIDNWIAEHLG